MFATEPRRETSFCTLNDQFALEFCQCGENPENEAAIGSRCVDRGTFSCENPETDFARGQFADGVDQVSQVAA